VLSSDFEDDIRKGIRSTSSGSFLSLEPGVAEDLMDKFSLAIEGLTISTKDMVVLSSVDIRRFLKKFIESKFKDLEVISYGELTDSVSINVLKTI
jgi:type III secretion protein V